MNGRRCLPYYIVVVVGIPRTDNTVKHMRVCRKPIDQVQHYFLSESRFFRSVVELVSYYEKTSLSENFEG